MIEFDMITTRGGDSGLTSIADGSRRSKDDLLIEVLGEVDEVHSALGLMKAALNEILEKDEINWIQQCLIRIGAMIAVPPSHPGYKKLDVVDQADIDKLETWQKEAMADIEMPKVFITYGNSEAGARADMARGICRRAERRIVSLIRERRMRDLAGAQRFLNRLSDYLFVRARELDDYQD